MKVLTYQRGVGLVEVLVAVLLLSVAVLGFSALQMRAITATDESLVRTKSLTVVRNLAEVMRAYPEAYVTGSGSSFSDAAPLDTGAEPTVQAIVSSSSTDTVTVGGDVISILASGNNCLSTDVVTTSGNSAPKQPCSINQLAARDTLMIKKMAADEEIEIAVTMCPGTSVQAIQQQMCVITAWNDTEALLDDSNAKACADSNGVYKTGSQCLISEAY
ncbi:type IV pilus modification protein PilV [Psychrobacter fjordensis]|uniref:type IV pilus modification protein PilV n=1 Tax=Psychrobacter fjordensis TaxID=664424 RepID=UPI00191ADF0D|nr:type IV pilus modification protein PilV [Psychrobacter fjordensis]